MAVPVTELIPQQFSYFERGSAHTLELRSIYPLKDNRRGAMEKKLVYIAYSCHTGDFGPWARFRHMAGQKNWKMRYLFKRLDQQTTTTAHPQWAMGTHRSAPCLHLDGLVNDLDTPIFFELPPHHHNHSHEVDPLNLSTLCLFPENPRLPVIEWGMCCRFSWFFSV